MSIDLTDAETRRKYIAYSSAEEELAKLKPTDAGFASHLATLRSMSARESGELGKSCLASYLHYSAKLQAPTVQ